MKRSVLALALVVTLAACAVQKTLVPTGGSRSDGTVEMSYDVSMFEAPKVDLKQGAIRHQDHAQRNGGAGTGRSVLTRVIVWVQGETAGRHQPNFQLQGLSGEPALSASA